MTSRDPGSALTGSASLLRNRAAQLPARPGRSLAEAILPRRLVARMALESNSDADASKSLGVENGLDLGPVCVVECE